MLRKLSRVILGATAVIMTSMALHAQAQTAPIRLKLQTGVPSASIYFELMKNFSERVDKSSNGRLKFEAWSMQGLRGLISGQEKTVLRRYSQIRQLVRVWG